MSDSKNRQDEEQASENLEKNIVNENEPESLSIAESDFEEETKAMDEEETADFPADGTAEHMEGEEISESDQASAQEESGSAEEGAAERKVESVATEPEELSGETDADLSEEMSQEEMSGEGTGKAVGGKAETPAGDSEENSFLRTMRRYRMTPARLGILAGICILFFVLFLFLRPGKKATPLTISSDWTDLGMIGERFYFRSESHLTGYLPGKNRVEIDLEPDVQKIQYGHFIYAFVPENYIAVYNAEKGNLTRRIDASNVEDIQVIYDRKKKEDRLILKKADRFVIADQEGNVRRVLTTEGKPGAFLFGTDQEAWSVGGTPQTKTDGEVNFDPEAMAGFAETKEKEIRSGDMQKTALENITKRNVIAFKTEEAIVRVPTTLAPVKKLLWMDDGSLVAASSNGIVHIQKDGTVHFLPVLQLLDVMVQGQSIYALDDQTLRIWNADGIETERFALEFPPQNLIWDKDHPVIYGVQEKAEILGDQVETTKTATFYGVRYNEKGEPFLITADGIAPLS